MITRTLLLRDRRDAGRRLADRLVRYARRDDLLILGLPRGGVPVAFEVARALEAPLDVLVVRKLGVPGHEELAMGAIAGGGVQVLNQDVVAALEIPASEIERVTAAELEELRRREAAYRGTAPAPNVAGRTVILVDDGLATGATMTAAVQVTSGQGARRVVVAVPVAAATTCAALRDIADDVVCLLTPPGFAAVGEWYEDFSPTGDEEVRTLLARSRQARIEALEPPGARRRA